MNDSPPDSTYELKPGLVFWEKRRDTKAVMGYILRDPHCWCVLSHPFSAKGSSWVLFAAFSSLKNAPSDDPACTFRPGDISCLSQHSFVFYDDTKVWREPYLSAYVNSDDLTESHLYLSADMTRSVLLGAGSSQHFDGDYLQVLRGQGLLN